MRSFLHWSPRYLINRSIEKIYRLSNPDLPWLTPQANSILGTWLLPQDRGLEFGSGRSTLWFCQRVAHLFSVEHNPAWYEIVTERLRVLKFNNVDYWLARKDERINTSAAYVTVAEALENESLDFVLVDGIFRDECAALALRKLRRGGLLLIDNVNHYLPSNSISPNSIPIGQIPASPVWENVHTVLKTWRLIWTSNGVSDTAFFFKP